MARQGLMFGGWCTPSLRPRRVTRAFLGRRPGPTTDGGALLWVWVLVDGSLYFSLLYSLSFCFLLSFLCLFSVCFSSEAGGFGGVSGGVGGGLRLGLGGFGLGQYVGRRNYDVPVVASVLQIVRLTSLCHCPRDRVIRRLGAQD